MSSVPNHGRAPAGLILRLLAGAASLALMAGAAQAQTTEHDEDTEVEEFVVSGTRNLPGAVIGDIAPELSISPREIRAYGAGTVTELLDALAPQTTSGQGGGRPVVLINGARTSGFSEIRDLPTEAIARVDILPEEVSLKYGYPAEQKVVNIVLRQRFRAWLAEGIGQAPTQSGGGQSVAAHGGLLKIEKGRRLTLDAKVTQVEPILESERDVVDGEGAFRTLAPGSTDVTLNAVLAQPLGRGVQGTVNGTFQSTDTKSRLGQSSATGEPLIRKSQVEDGRLAGVLSGAYAGWQWSTTAEVSRDVSKSNTDRALAALAYTDWTRAVTTSAQTDIVLNRAFGDLPAGQISSTLTGRLSTMELESDALRAGLTQSSDLTRNIGQVQASFDVPLTRAGEGLGEKIGKVSGNLNLGLQNLSDFGDLATVGGGLNWTPVKPLRVMGSFSRTDQAPTMNQLGDPVTATPGVRVFDFARGETVEVIRVTGGSRDLDGGQRDVLKLGFSYKPFEKTNLNFQANYVSTRTEDAVVAFPSASTQVEAAFPERFRRDADGVLVQVDARPVNFARQSRDELRWGFTYSRPVGPTPTPEQISAMRRARAEAAGGQGAATTPGQPPREGQPPTGERPPREGGGPPPPSAGGAGPGGFSGGPGGGGRGGGGGFGGFGGGGPRGGVFQVGLYHTLAFRDDVLIRPGLPKLDLLDGGALGAGGGSPRHQIDLQTNYTRAGLGVAMNAKWQSATHVDGGTASEDLEFEDFATVNLRLFADLGQQPIAREHRWLRGARATLSITNLFDSRQDVRTPAGITPISYQPDIMDPVGRSVRLTVRKLIF
ncbi:MAG: TonB-dependent receptor [Phenylobacterium sp.]|uniref:TonB-dependent receptor n=1 Tax=Phenylobacterium sp. TaxID=1871053 RepID=UPI00271FDF6D|nr:TonB-dependent receptor [Phenylobacterium sp.]MDO9431109.1 TonB-dependent receptor [Phenylobacterium sp.]